MTKPYAGTKGEETPASMKQPDLRVLRRLRVTRYCAYSSVLPQLARQCQCWSCSDRRGARGIRIEICPDTRELEAEIQSAIDALEANAVEVADAS